MGRGKEEHPGCLLKGQFIAGPKHSGARYLPKGTLTVCTLKVPLHLPRIPLNPLLQRPVPYRQEVNVPIHFTSNSSLEQMLLKLSKFRSEK